MDNSTGIPNEFLSKFEKTINSKSKFEDILNLVYKKILKLLEERKSIMSKKELTYIDAILGELNTSQYSVKNIIARPDGVVSKDGFKLFELNTTTSIGGTLVFSKILDYVGSSMLSPLGAQTKFLRTNYPERKIINWRLSNRDDYAEEEIEISKILNKNLNVKFEGIRSDEDFLKKFSKEHSDYLFYRTISTSESRLKREEIYKIESHISSECNLLPASLSDVLSSKIFFAIASKYIQCEFLAESYWINRTTSQVEINHYIKNKNLYIIKKDLSYQGKDVAVGREMSLGEWRSHVSDCLKSENYIVQKVYESDFEDWLIGSRSIKAKYIVSPYFFGGLSGGNVARIRLDDGLIAVLPGITNTAVGSLKQRIQQ